MISPDKHTIACSIFKKEIEYLIEIGHLNGTFSFVDSELHMNPEELEKSLTV